jgi:hypothetical protein
MKKNSTGSVAN